MSINIARAGQLSELRTLADDIEAHVEQLTNNSTALVKKCESLVQKNIKAPGDHLYYCMSCQDFKNIFLEDQAVSKQHDHTFVYRVYCPTCREGSSRCAEQVSTLKTELIGKGILVVKEESKANQ